MNPTLILAIVVAWGLSLAYTGEHYYTKGELDNHNAEAAQHLQDTNALIAGFNTKEKADVAAATAAAQARVVYRTIYQEKSDALQVDLSKRPDRPSCDRLEPEYELLITSIDIANGAAAKAPGPGGGDGAVPASPKAGQQVREGSRDLGAENRGDDGGMAPPAQRVG